MASSSSSSETHGASKLTAPDQRCSATLPRHSNRRFEPRGGAGTSGKETGATMTQ
jgi:hypothetical protein